MERIIRKIIAIFLVVVTIFTSTDVSVFAEDIHDMFLPDTKASMGEDEWSYNILEDETIEITAYNGVNRNIVVPDTIDEKIVSGIAREAFRGKNIVSVELPDTVKTLGSYCFRHCNNLTSINLNKVESIGAYCFDECNALESVILPETLTTVGTEIFRKCISVNSISISCNKLTDAKQMFAGCTNIENISFSDDVSSIPREMFMHTSIKRVILPDNIKTIGYAAFKNSEIGELDLNKVENIEIYAFEGTHGFKTLVLPASLKSLSYGAFLCYNYESDVEELYYNCENIDKVSNTYYECFSALKKLKSVYIGPSVKEIPQNLFKKFPATNVYVNGDGIKFNKKVFSECNDLKNAFFSGTNYSFDDTTFFSCPNTCFYVPDNSTPLIYAIANNIKYEIVNVEERESIFKDNETDYYVSSSSVINKHSNLKIKYELKDEVSLDDNASVSVFLGKNISLASVEPVKVNGNVVRNYEFKSGILAIPVNSKKSEIDVLIKTSDLKKMQPSYAKLSDSNIGEVIGTLIIGDDIFTVYTDKKTSKKEITVKGTAPKDAVIGIYEKTDILGEFTANKLGYYEGNIELPSGENNTLYNLTAKTSADGYEYEAKANVKYVENYPELDRFDMVYYTIHTGYVKVDMLNVQDNTLIYLAPSYGFKFYVDFENRESIDKVYVTSEKNGEIKSVLLHWDDKLGCYYSDEKFEPNNRGYIPGKLSVAYTLKCEIPQYDLSTEEGLDAATEAFELLDEEVLDETYNITADVIENTEDTFIATFTNESGANMDVEVHRIDCSDSGIESNSDAGRNVPYVGEFKSDAEGVTSYASGFNYDVGGTTALDVISDILDGKPSTVKKYIIENGVKVGENLYALNLSKQDISLSDIDFRLLIYDAAMDDIQSYVIKGASELTGIPLGDYVSFCTNVRDGKFDAILKNGIEKMIDVNSPVVGPAVNAAFGVGGLYINALGEYKKLFYDTSLSPEERAQREADLDRYFCTQMSCIAINFAGTLCKDLGIKMMMAGNPWGLALCAASIIAIDFAKWYANEYDGDGFVLAEYLESKAKAFKYIIDPSGVVYEAVPDNYLEGVTATIYYRDSGGQEVLWNAEEYLQRNPVVTDRGGAYAWDVPEGTWRVKFTKENYEDAFSEWMDVPPEQTDVNIAMVSKLNPAVEYAHLGQDSLEIKFSQYMNVSTVKGIKLFEPTGKEISYKVECENELANVITLSLIDTRTIRGLNYNLKIPAGVLNYCGKELEEGTLTVRAKEPERIRCVDRVNVAIGNTVNVPIAIDNYAGKNEIICHNQNECLVSSEVSKVDDNGNAVLKLSGILRGECNVELTLSDGTSSVDIELIVGDENDAVIDLPEYVGPIWEDKCIDGTEHLFVAMIKDGLVEQQTKKETCTENGVYKKYCTKCNALSSETFEIPAIGHAWDTGIITKKSTYTEKGVKVFTCQNDNSHTKTVEVPTLESQGDVIDEDLDEFTEADLASKEIRLIGIKDVTYTGSNITFDVRVYKGNKLLKEGIDYSLKYTNNKNACTDISDANMAKAPTVTFTGKGIYKSEPIKTVRFKINRVDISDLTASNDTVAYAKNKKNKPVPTLMLDGKKLRAKMDYSIVYDDAHKDGYTEEGTYAITLNGEGNYTGSTTSIFRIKDQKKYTFMSKVNVTGYKNSFVYDGQAKVQDMSKVVLKTGSGKNTVYLKENVDFTVSYINNTEVGTASMILSAVEGSEKYVGEKIITYKITGTAISKAKVTYDNKQVYTGKTVKPLVKLEVGNRNNAKTLVEGVHYTVEYQKNVNAGNAVILIKGKGEYTGTVKKAFKISPIDVSSDKNISVKTIGTATKNEKTRKYEIKVEVRNDGKLLKEGVDYTLSYKNNSKIASAADRNAPTVTIKGKGNYTKNLSVTFDITE